ncbi:MAG: hypothetical protein FXF47_04215 [Candidatus Mcinerneyibacterium aminivorans]|uniref:Uncharacterized protein n=1 Tax=Candidatus Mcinerneyibacterium aminivorans TaxID=2703815 RepID=A0A5D0MJ32_9BACT|nr:MAG: hypothetical protein FXF47_04215 [Candidatus Mcinerneyibacterium aminivorans]
MSERVILHIILFVIFLISYFIVDYFWRKKYDYNIYAKVVYKILKLSTSISLSLLILLLGLRKIYSIIYLRNYESMRIIITGVFLLSIAMQVIAYLNLKFMDKY